MTTQVISAATTAHSASSSCGNLILPISDPVLYLSLRGPLGLGPCVNHEQWAAWGGGARGSITRRMRSYGLYRAAWFPDASYEPRKISYLLLD